MELSFEFEKLGLEDGWRAEWRDGLTQAPRPLAGKTDQLGDLEVPGVVVSCWSLSPLLRHHRHRRMGVSGPQPQSFERTEWARTWV